MIKQNYRGDFIVAQTFYKDVEEDGTAAKKQVAVPDHVIVEFFTKPGSGVYAVERDGEMMKSCTISPDGMTLFCNIALSRKCIGMGTLYRNTIEVSEDDAFPNKKRYVPSPEPMDINLYPGPSDDTNEILSEAVLSSIRYGYSAYQLAVQHGYTGTEEEWLAYLKPEITINEDGNLLINGNLVITYIITATEKETEAIALGANLNGASSGGGAGYITVDSELSLTSINPVQNKVITAALNDKQAAGEYVTKTELLSAAATDEEIQEIIEELEV